MAEGIPTCHIRKAIFRAVPGEGLLGLRPVDLVFDDAEELGKIVGSWMELLMPRLHGLGSIGGHGHGGSDRRAWRCSKLRAMPQIPNPASVTAGNQGTAAFNVSSSAIGGQI